MASTKIMPPLDSADESCTIVLIQETANPGGASSRSERRAYPHIGGRRRTDLPADREPGQVLDRVATAGAWRGAAADSGAGGAAAGQSQHSRAGLPGARDRGRRREAAHGG